MVLIGKFGTENFEAKLAKELVTIHEKDGTPFRKNYAGVGFTYDAQRDAFIPPKPFPSWVLNEETCLYDPPTPYPKDENRNVYVWNEGTTTWERLMYPN